MQSLHTPEISPHPPEPPLCSEVFQLLLVCRHRSYSGVWQITIRFSQISTWSSLTKQLFSFSTLSSSSAGEFVLGLLRLCPVSSRRRRLHARFMSLLCNSHDPPYNSKHVWIGRLVHFHQGCTSSLSSLLIFLKAKVGLQRERERENWSDEKEGEAVCFEGVPPLSLSPSYEGWGCWRFGDDWWSL